MKLHLHNRGAPEDSIAMRVVAAAAVEVALVALVAQGALEPFTAVAGLAIAPLGYAFSYRQRHRSNLATKVVLSFALLAAFASFLQSVRLAGNVDAARAPLATLFVWVQVLHAFDVPRRRDLAFSVVSSVILIAEAGSLSLSPSLLIFVVPWGALACVWLYLSSRPLTEQVAAPVRVRRERTSSRPLAPIRSVGAAAIVVTSASFAVFLAIPRLPGTFVSSLPFSLGHASRVGGFDGAVSNPGLPESAGDGFTNFSPTAYPGFGSSVDLRSRGRLSSRIVMLVRAPQPALWRGQVYDTFSGTAWTASDPTTTSLTGGGAEGADVPIDSDTGALWPITRKVVQTFYVQTPQPNVVFSAYRPQQVYFPAGGLREDRYGSIRAPFVLDRGTVYSVISQVPVTSTGILRSASGPFPRGFRRYLQVPPDLPTRDLLLARQITSASPTEYDAVLAVQRWLQTNTRYDLDVPRDPPGVDAVDQFLFVRRAGFCEHIASALAVLLRESGIPTRFVVGFGPGERDPLTGYYEVRESDAHAWVEVYYPNVGWVPYDPTFGVPEAAPGVGSRFIAPEVFRAMSRLLGRITPEPLKALARAIGGAWMFLLVPVLGALGVGLVAHRRRGRIHRPPPTGAAKAFADLTRALARTGHGRAAHQTPDEYLAELPADLATDAEVVVRAFERERFSASTLSREEIEAAFAAAHRARQLAGRGSRRGG